ncbi:unnamed protein product, partial [Prorocentrum cordatum]
SSSSWSSLSPSSWSLPDSFEARARRGRERRCVSCCGSGYFGRPCPSDRRVVMAGDHGDGAAAPGRIDQKLIASMVNTWVAESGEFMQAFARHAEVKLLELGSKVDRLERLVHLFEHKLRDFEPAPAGPAAPSPREEAAPTQPRVPPTGPQGDEGPGGAAAAEAAPAAAAAEDERYAVYRRMKNAGVPEGAIRHKFETDASNDPGLDRGLLNGILGSKGEAAPTAPRPPPPAPGPPHPAEPAAEGPAA